MPLPSRKRFQWLRNTANFLARPFKKKDKSSEKKPVKVAGLFDKASVLERQVSDEEIKRHPTYTKWFEYFFKDRLLSTPEKVSTRDALRDEITRLQNLAILTDDPMEVITKDFSVQYLRGILSDPVRLSQVEKIRVLSKKRSETSRIARDLGRKRMPVETRRLVEKAKTASTTARFAQDPDLKDFIKQTNEELGDALVAAGDLSSEELRRVFFSTVEAIIVRETARVSLDPSLGQTLLKKIRYLTHVKKELK